MNRKNDGCTGIRILSPLTGTAVALGEVPDPVFSQKIIGDGVAIIPRDGKLVSPIDGGLIDPVTGADVGGDDSLGDSPVNNNLLNQQNE